MGNLPSESIMAFVRSLYGITKPEWEKVRFVMECSFGKKEREAEKAICLSSDDDVVNPF